MKSFLAISFLILYLIPSTELNELLKIPALIEHFREHQVESGDLGFWSFLELHYGQDHGNTGDHEQDSHLPFKSASDCFHASFSAITPSVTLSPQRFIMDGLNDFFCWSDYFTHSAFLSAVFQPPRF